MKRLMQITLAAAGLLACATSHAFINLDFEAAQIVPIQPDQNPENSWLHWSAAMPGWSEGGGTGSTGIYRGFSHVGFQPFYVLSDQQAEYAFNAPLEGRFSLTMKSGNVYSGNPDEPIGAWFDAYVSQTGYVPEDTRSLRLLADGPIRVQFGDQAIALVSLGSNAWAGDFSSFAGQSGELKIISDNTYSVVTIDNIQFSTAPIPEPTELALVSAGLAMIAARRFSRRKAADSQ